MVLIEELEHLQQIRSVETITISSESPDIRVDILEFYKCIVELVILILFDEDVDGEFSGDERSGLFDLRFDLVLVLDAFLDHGLHFFRDFLAFLGLFLRHL